MSPAAFFCGIQINWGLKCASTINTLIAFLLFLFHCRQLGGFLSKATAVNNELLGDIVNICKQWKSNIFNRGCGSKNMNEINQTMNDKVHLSCAPWWSTWSCVCGELLSSELGQPSRSEANTKQMSELFHLSSLSKTTRLYKDSSTFKLPHW